MKTIGQKMAEDLELRGMSPHTTESYLRYARQFADHCKKPPRRASTEDVRAFLLHLRSIRFAEQWGRSERTASRSAA